MLSRNQWWGFVLPVIIAAGCDNKSGSTPSGSAPAIQAASQPVTPLIQKAEVIDWCREHGVPESKCTLCNASLIAKFKDSGDWCNQHGVPESQCFICHPELRQKFADEYKARYGKAPPATQATS